jgi:hypothetical protein
VTVSLIVNRIGVHKFLSHIRKELKSGSFRPVPVRQVMINRVVQAALKLGP